MARSIRYYAWIGSCVFPYSQTFGSRLFEKAWSIVARRLGRRFFFQVVRHLFFVVGRVLVYLFVSPTTAGSGLVCVFSVHHCWPQTTSSTWSSSRRLTRSSSVVISSRVTSSKLLIGPFHPVFVLHHRRSPSCPSSSSFI